ncbi:hypothetical protein ABT255_22475 [Streptomyces mirabilis]|uniref:hypothetical protein n=1 Tax=Streptomyces TaxID=1883 RepID=UPI0013DC6C84|nr:MULTISPECIES: hypothetical protein [unclassified Streptomyces]
MAQFEPAAATPFRLCHLAYVDPARTSDAVWKGLADAFAALPADPRLAEEHEHAALMQALLDGRSMDADAVWSAAEGLSGMLRGLQGFGQEAVLQGRAAGGGVDSDDFGSPVHQRERL